MNAVTAVNVLHYNELVARAQLPVRGRRAVVIGASLAGLMTARVLADTYDEVVLLDRDTVPLDDRHRKATPHTQHTHGLLARGLEVIEQLFPGITATWIERGGTLCDVHAQIPFYAGGVPFTRAESAMRCIVASRAAIEGEVRRRVLAMPGVLLCDKVDVRQLTTTGDVSRVTGVQLSAPGRSATAQLAADLVVDASGRTSRLPQWLVALGHEAPEEERVKVDITYATAYLKREAWHPSGARGVVCAPDNLDRRIGVMLGQEGDRWVVTLGGYRGDAPPLTKALFVQRAQLMGREIAETLAHAEFIGEPAGYRFPHSQRRHYERLKRFPEGLLAIGDALCAFNPIYGQGMSVAACEALALQECLSSGDAALATRFFKRASRVVDAAWSTAVGADLALDFVEGKRTAGIRFINAYMARVFRAAVHDPVVARAFYEVAHLRRQPPSIMRPSILARVMWSTWRRRKEHASRLSAVAASLP